MLYKNYSIWIQRNTCKKNLTEGDWEAFINEENVPHLDFFDNWYICIDGISPKHTFEVAKQKIDEKIRN